MADKAEAEGGAREAPQERSKGVGVPAAAKKKPRRGRARLVVGLLLLLLLICLGIAMALTKDQWLPRLREMFGASGAGTTTVITRETLRVVPAASEQAQQPLPGEVWPFKWEDVAGGTCFLDDSFEDAAVVFEKGQTAAALNFAEQLKCRPRNSSMKLRLVKLQQQSSNLGRERIRRIQCSPQEETKVPFCCLPRRNGLTVSERARLNSDFETREDAFAALCRARYGCATDPVYAKRLMPWIPAFPLDCFQEASVNTCAYMLLEQERPGTFFPNPVALESCNGNHCSELLNQICGPTHDGTRPPVVVPGPEMGRIIPDDLRHDCAQAGADVQENTSAGCAPAGQ